MEGQQYDFHVFGTDGIVDHSLGMGTSAFDRTDNLDGLVEWSSRDLRDQCQQSNDGSLNYAGRYAVLL